MTQFPTGSSAPNTSAAESKIKPPAICLIVVAVLSLLFGAYSLFNNAMALVNPPSQAEIEAELERGIAEEGLDAQQAELARSWVGTATSVGPVMGTIWALALTLASIVIIWGGVKMLQLRSYGLAMTASVLALIPCISPCCVLGIPFGIWALVVLRNNDVKAAFT